MNQMDNGLGSNGSSYIDPDSTVEGTIRTDHDLRVEGSVSGTVQCDGVLFVAEGAIVDAEIDANTIIVAGEMSGTVRCRGRLEIQSSGVVRGDVRTGALVIQEGARYEGQIAMEGTDAATPVEAPVDQPSTLDEEEPSNDAEYSFLRRFAPDEEDDTVPDDETS